jgi:hypothetical protein
MIWADIHQLSTHELAVAETESLTDPGLLAEILEAREELDMATSPEEVDEIRQTNSGESAKSNPLRDEGREN